MLTRVCCLLFLPKSPKNAVIGLFITVSVITVALLFFADFRRQLVHSSVFHPSFEKRAAFYPNVSRYRLHRICPDSGLNTFAIIFVCSAPGNVLRRQVIRTTWGNSQVTKSLRLGVVFIIAASNDATIQRAVDWEAEVYGDTVQPTFLDTYNNLTMKTLSGLKWVTEHCSKSTFVIKADDDVFINTYALQRFLSDHKSDGSSLMCLAWSNRKPDYQKRTPWAVTYEQYNGTTYPTFCCGRAYIMSIPVARTLHKASLTVPNLYIEDVFVTGILAKNVGVGHKNMKSRYADNNKSLKISDLAEGKIIFVHISNKQSTEDISMWKKVYAYEDNKLNHTNGNVSTTATVT